MTTTNKLEFFTCGNTSFLLEKRSDNVFIFSGHRNLEQFVRVSVYNKFSCIDYTTPEGYFSLPLSLVHSITASEAKIDDHTHPKVLLCSLASKDCSVNATFMFHTGLFTVLQLVTLEGMDYLDAIRSVFG
jgi:hypothetical protein